MDLNIKIINMSYKIKANPQSIKKNSPPYLKRFGIQDSKFEKRFAKNNEAMRSKLFKNFINTNNLISN